MSEPFGCRIIREIISKEFFRGPSSIAAQNQGLFRSSDPNKADELEVPKPMVAVACVAVCWCSFSNLNIPADP